MSKIVEVKTDVRDKEAWLAALKLLFGDDNVRVYNEPVEVMDYDGSTFLADMELDPRLNVYRKRGLDTPSGENTDLAVNSETGQIWLDDEASRKFLKLAQEAAGMEPTDLGGWKSGAEVIGATKGPLENLLTGVAKGMQSSARMRLAGWSSEFEWVGGKVLRLTMRPRGRAQRLTVKR